MTKLYTTIKTAAEKRAAYNRTVRELESMPVDIALDVGIYPGDARAIAHRIVYGA